MKIIMILVVHQAGVVVQDAPKHGILITLQVFFFFSSQASEIAIQMHATSVYKLLCRINVPIQDLDLSIFLVA